jgi:hypothetical protein
MRRNVRRFLTLGKLIPIATFNCLDSLMNMEENR